VIVGLRPATVNECHFVDLLTQMGKQTAAPRSALAMLRPFKWGFHEGADGVWKEARFGIESWQRLAIPFLQFWFVVPCVHVTGAAIGEDPNDGFGLGGSWGRFGGEGILRCRGASMEHGLQGEPSHAASGALQKLAAIHHARVDWG
jgi:hypothetical protein